jgi:hypothetical protein
VDDQSTILIDFDSGSNGICSLIHSDLGYASIICWKMRFARNSRLIPNSRIPPEAARPEDFPFHKSDVKTRLSIRKNPFADGGI